jgi:DNA-binding IclR family transcriptional regulator
VVQSVERALKLLKIIGSVQKKWTLAELSELSDLAPSTVHRLLLTLKNYRFIAQDIESSLYYLGPALISLGMGANNYLDIRKAAIPIMEDLAKTSKEDVFLAIADGNQGIFVERIPGPHPLKVIGPVLERVPLHCGAIRKVLLAYSNDSFIQNFLRNGLDRYTDNTQTDPDLLLQTLKQIRQDGYAVTVSEYTNDAVGIGAPVFDHYGEIAAAMGIIGPSVRIIPEKYPPIIQLVKAHAQELSSALGHHNLPANR